MSDFEMVVRYEINTGSQWVDVTDDVRVTEDQVITRGRPDESSACDPGKLTFKINNRDGRYSPRNPLSPYYGLIGRNTPVRLSVQGAPVHLRVPGVAGARLRAASPPAVTGDLDVRLELALDQLPTQMPEGTSTAYAEAYQAVMGRYDAAGNQRAWRLLTGPGGEMLFGWSSSGTALTGLYTSTESVPYPPGVRCALRATLDVNNGSSGHTVTFYTAPGLDGPWRQLGEPVTGSGTTSIYAATAALDIGHVQSQIDTNFTYPGGAYYRAEIRSGIGGTVVAAPDLTAQATGATSFTDSAGVAWTVQGDAEVTDWHVRGVWEVTSWPSRWDVSGVDVHVPVEAQGILRRLGQGQKALQSTLRRRIPSFAADGTVVAYWPCEEESGATQIYSPIPGVQPMQLGDATTVEFGADDSLGGSAALPSWGEDAQADGRVPGATPGEWQVEFVYKLDELPSSLNTLFVVRTTVLKYVVRVQTDNVQLHTVDADEAWTQRINGTAPEFTGRWLRFQLSATQSGGSIDVHLGWRAPGSSGFAFDTSFAATAGRVRSVSPLGPGGTLYLGHIGVMSATGDAPYEEADTGFTGESSADRCRRLAQEERQTVATAGLDAETTAMGPQRPDALLDLLQDAADADGGVLGELRTLTGLQVRPRVAAYNCVPALELDYAAGEIAPDLEPEDDDQEIRNDVTVQREGGSSARATLDTGALSTQAPPDGVGVYDESVTVNAESDGQLDQIAGWRLHLGTVDELRYPTVTLNLANSRMAAARETWLTHVDVGSRITIDNPPAWLPPGPIDLIVQSYTETINQHAWEVELTCTPALPWTVGHVAADDPDDDFAPVHLDTDGSELAAAATATATSLSVAVTDGPLWTTDGADVPFDIRVGGEVMTVTAISGGSSPQTFTVTRSVNGIAKAHAAGADVRLADPQIIAL